MPMIRPQWGYSTIALSNYLQGFGGSGIIWPLNDTDAYAGATEKYNWNRLTWGTDYGVDDFSNTGGSPFEYQQPAIMNGGTNNVCMNFQATSGATAIEYGFAELRFSNLGRGVLTTAGLGRTAGGWIKFGYTGLEDYHTQGTLKFGINEYTIGNYGNGSPTTTWATRFPQTAPEGRNQVHTGMSPLYPTSGAISVILTTEAEGFDGSNFTYNHKMYVNGTFLREAYGANSRNASLNDTTTQILVSNESDLVHATRNLCYAQDIFMLEDYIMSAAEISELAANYS